MTENDKQTELQNAWKMAVDFTEILPGSVERALFRGWNIRVKFPAAFIAAYRAIEAGMEVSAAITTQLNWPSAILKSCRAALLVFSSLVESMKPLSYFTAVVLSTHEKGIDEASLLDEVNRFLDAPNTSNGSWHLGASASRVDEARADRADPDWLRATIRDLDSKGFLTRNGDKLFPKEKHVEWKIGY